MNSITKTMCGYCKYFAQGKNCSFCDNSKQPIQSLKEYAYYNFECELFENGTHQTRIDYMKSLKNK
jgi:hypothetical protein